MKKVLFYAVSTAAVALTVLGLALLGAVDAGAPIFPTYIVIMLVGASAFGLFFVAQCIAIAEGMLIDLTEEERGR